MNRPVPDDDGLVECVGCGDMFWPEELDDEHNLCQSCHDYYDEQDNTIDKEAL